MKTIKRYPNNYWKYDTCFEEAKKYHSRVEMLRANKTAYNVAYKNGYISDYTWFKSTAELHREANKNRAKWTFEKCKECALQYSNRQDFKFNCKSAFNASVRYKWIKEFDWLKKYSKSGISYKDNIYIYCFPGTKYIYIGRTVDPKQRHISHKSKNDTLFKFAKRNKLLIPPMQVIERELLSVDIGREREDYWANYFWNRGFVVLNKAKTGKNCGSIGGLGYDKWTYATCYKKAKEYKTLKDFADNNVSAYIKAHKMGWDKEYEWLKRNNPRQEWTYEQCHNEAAKYLTREEFRIKNRSAHQKAYKEGWLYEWFSKRSTTAKAVLQFSIEGTFLREFKSITEASGNIRHKISGIVDCCKGRQQTAFGYIWKYKKEGA